MPEGNRADPVPPSPWWGNLGSRLIDPVPLLLAGVAVASFVIDRRSTAVVVGALAVLNVLMASADRPRSRLQQELRLLRAGVGAVAGLGVALVVLLGLARGIEPRDLVLVGTAMAIGAIPAGLSAFVHGLLSTGARRLADAHVGVSSLHDVETLGAATTILSRTTGILTLDQLTARTLWYQGQWIRVAGSGYSKHGLILRTAGEPNPDFQTLAVALTLAGDATVSDHGDVTGDPVEAALVVLAAKLGFDADESRRAFPLLGGVPAGPDEGVTTTLHRLGEGRVVEVVTGDADVVLARSSKFAVGSSDDEPIGRHRLAVQEAMARLSGEGLRVVAVADRHFDEAPGDAPDPLPQVGELRLIALVGIADPVRPTAKAALSSAQLAGIEVRLITDDDAPTSAAFGAELSMGPGVIGAAEFGVLSDEELAERLPGLCVFGQVDSEDTLRLVRLTQARGEVVALIGNAPRDAAPLERADLGVVTGSGSTDSQQPARIVLTDDRFETLVHTIELGRSTYAKVAFLLRYQVTQLVALVLLFAAASILNGNEGVALTPFMVLFLSIVVAAGPAVMISLDPIGGAELRRSPPDASGQLINRFALSRWGLYGAAQFGAAAIPLLFEWKVDASSPGTTVAFVVLAFGTLLGGLAMRREPGSGFGVPMLRALGILAVPAMLTVFAVELQFLRELLGTNDLAGGEWFVALVLAFGLPVVVEMDKVFRRQRNTSGPAKSGGDASQAQPHGWW